MDHEPLALSQVCTMCERRVYVSAWVLQPQSQIRKLTTGRHKPAVRDLLVLLPGAGPALSQTPGGWESKGPFTAD